MAHVAAAMLRIPRVEVVVVTDDAAIAQAARAVGAGAWLSRRSAESGSDRIRHYLDDSGRDWPEVLANVQGDEPLLEPEAVEALLDRLRSDSAIWAATLLRGEPTETERGDPNVVKAALLPDGRIADFARLPVEDDPPVASEDDLACARRHRWLVHVGVYAFRAGAFHAFTDLPPSPRELREHLEQLRMVEAGATIHGVIFPTNSFGIDTPEDLERAEQRLGAALPSGKLAERSSGPGARGRSG